MDYYKLDASLAAALKQASSGGTLSVFIHPKGSLTPEQVEELKSLGFASAQGDRILTAAVSPEAVAKLSDFPWIEQISLAKKRRPL